MSPCRPAYDRRAAAWSRVSNIAGACFTCSPPAGDLLGHLLMHLLSWTNRPRILLAKLMIDHGKMQQTSIPTAAEKSAYLLEQVGAGESASNIVATLFSASVPYALFFHRPNPHSVAMLRNIC
jgi:hypothetical protein